MKKLSAFFSVLTFFLFSILCIICTTHPAYAVFRVEVDPNPVLSTVSIQMTAFDCAAGSNVRFFWRTNKNANSYTTSPLKAVVKNTDAQGTLIAVHTLVDGLSPGTYYVHANCSNPSQDSPEIDLVVKDVKTGKPISGETVNELPDTIEGYTKLPITYTNFQAGECYGIRLSVNSFETKGKGSYLPNYSRCGMPELLDGYYFESDTLPASGSIVIDGLRPGNYTVFVDKNVGRLSETIYRKIVRVTDSTKTPLVEIKPTALKIGDSAQISASGCPPNSPGNIYWSKKDHQLNDQKGTQSVTFDGNGKATFPVTFNDKNNNELWVECGAGLKSPFSFFTVTDKDLTTLPKVFMKLPSETEAHSIDTTKTNLFPKDTGIEIWAEKCPNVNGTANFQWKHAQQSNGLQEQVASRDNVKIDKDGATEHFSVAFKDDRNNQIQVFCADAQSLPLYFTIGDPDNTSTNTNPTKSAPTPTAVPIYAPCLEGINSAGQTITIAKPGENPSADVIKARLKDLVKCTKVDSALGAISTDPQGFILWLFQILLSISGGIALLAIIAAGYRYMTSQGNPEAIKAAQEQITSAIVGLLFLVFSMVLLQIIGVDILQLPGLSAFK